MVVVYHGFIPFDMYFFQEYMLRKMPERNPVTLVADFVFKIPMISYAVRLGGGKPATKTNAMDCLKSGGILIVAPGGVREAMTTTAEDYAVRWFGRQGFAKMAVETKATVIPMFTRNIREVFLVLGGGTGLVQRLYEMTKLPFTFFIGPFFLPLTSMLGKPIPFDPKRTIDSLASSSLEALQSLMQAAS